MRLFVAPPNMQASNWCYTYFVSHIEMGELLYRMNTRIITGRYGDVYEIN